MDIIEEVNLTNKLLEISRRGLNTEEEAQALFEAMPSNLGKSFKDSHEKGKYIELVLLRQLLQTKTSTSNDGANQLNLPT